MMFKNACDSPDYEVRDKMMHIVFKLTHPYYNGRFQGRTHQECWSQGEYFDIDADQLANFDKDMKRLKIAEKLKIIRLYWFKRTKDPDAKITINGEVISQDKWVYDQVTKFVHPNRIAFVDLPLPGMPRFPPEHWILETRLGAPYLKGLFSGKRLSKEVLGKYFV